MPGVETQPSRCFCLLLPSLCQICPIFICQFLSLGGFRGPPQKAKTEISPRSHRDLTEISIELLPIFGPKHQNANGFLRFLGFQACQESFKSRDSPKTAQDSPRRAQDRPKTAQDSPRQAQDSPKTGPRQPQDSPRQPQARTKNLKNTFVF